MPTTPTTPTTDLKKRLLEATTELQREKDRASKNISLAVSLALKDFHEATGFHLDKVDIAIIKHRSSASGRTKTDMTVVSGVELHIDIEGF